MAASHVRSHTSGQEKVSDATLALAIDGSNASVAGNLLVARVAFDNLTTSTPTVSSISKPGGESATWRRLASHGAFGSSAASGVRGEMWAIKTTVAWAAGTTVTVTLSASVSAKAGLLDEYSGVENTDRSTPGAQTTQSSVSVSTTGTAPQADDLVLAMADTESTAGNLDATDSDTTNGSWSSPTEIGTSGGSGATNISVAGVHKIPNASGHQTFNPTTTTGDSGGIIACLQQSAAGTDLTVAGATQAQTADSPTLSQVHNLAANGAVQAQTADSPTLTQVHNLVVQSAVHGHTAESPTVEVGATQLTVQDATHAQSSGSPALTQLHQLAVDAATHAQSSGSPALTQVHALAAAAATHGHTAGSPTLAQQHQIAAADATHAQSAESPSLTQVHALAADAAVHAQSAVSPALTQVHELVAADASHAQSAATPTLSQLHQVAVDAAVHAQTAESPSLDGAASLAVQSATHGQTADTPALSQLHVLAVDAATHAQTATGVALAQLHILTAHAAVHAHAANTPLLSQLHQLVVAAAHHTQIADSPTLQAFVGIPDPNPLLLKFTELARRATGGQDQLMKHTESSRFVAYTEEGP